MVTNVPQSGTDGGEMMKTITKGTIRDEKGKVMILVLILLVVGGLILAPLLGLISTGVLAGQVYEKKMDEYYAADAGIEDALWKITHDEIPTGAYAYNLTVNDNYVSVEVETTATDVEEILADLVDGGGGPHSDWLVTYTSPTHGTFSISITWNGTAQNKRIYSVGAWLGGTYSYVYGQAIPDDDIRAQYPIYTIEQKPHKGGTAFIWEWSGSDRPVFNQGGTKTLTFQFTPTGTPPMSVAWVEAGSGDVGVIYDGEFAFYTITATAVSDTGTPTADIGATTTVVAIAVPRGCAGDEIAVLNWNIS
jgi:hypothetical protein